MCARILLISHEYPPAIGGAGSVAKDIFNSFQREGIDVLVLTRKLEGRKKEDACKVIEVPFLPKVGFWFYRKKLASLDLKNFDYIVLNDVGAALVACLAISKKYWGKCIIWLHGSEPEQVLSKPSVFFRLVGFPKKYRKLLELSHRIIAVSEDLKKKFSECPESITFLKKIQIIHNPIDTAIFSTRGVNLHSRHSIHSSMTLLLSVGRVIREKGYDEMYECFKLIRARGGSFVWVLIGQGTFLPNLKAMAKRDGLDSEIKFLGVVERDRLAEYYSSVDVFWLLSRMREAFPLTYLESLACGTPVIARPSGGCVELLQRGKVGIFVNSQEECVNAILERKYSVFERQNLIAYASRFSTINFSKKILDIFR